MIDPTGNLCPTAVFVKTLKILFLHPAPPAALHFVSLTAMHPELYFVRRIPLHLLQPAVVLHPAALVMVQAAERPAQHKGYIPDRSPC